MGDPAGTRATVYSGSVQVPGGATVPVTATDGSAVLLPLGARCWAAEPDNAGARRTTIDHDAWDSAVVVETADQVGTMTITVTNTFDDRPVGPPSDSDAELAGTGAPFGLQSLLVAMLMVLSGGVMLAGRRRRRSP